MRTFRPTPCASMDREHSVQNKWMTWPWSSASCWLLDQFIFHIWSVVHSPLSRLSRALLCTKWSRGSHVARKSSGVKKVNFNAFSQEKLECFSRLGKLRRELRDVVEEALLFPARTSQPKISKLRSSKQTILGSGTKFI